ncbi:MAG TPA: tetratricopeptide repeat protein, partial [Blastocatellia bacterium]|nr:tetratricopeptide repeat protein [Blastocatellia bacterium]
MSKPKRFCSISLVIAFAFSTAAAHPQRGSLPGRPSGGDPTADGTIEGRIVLPSGQPVASGVKIILSTVTSEGITLYTDNNGGFSFKNLRAGNYSIEATGDTKLYDPASEKVRLIRGGRVHLVLHLKEKDTSAEKKPGSVISVAEVDQSVPAQAKQAYDKATRLAHEGRHEEAITEYKQAIARHPAYLVAHNDLGVQYLKLKRHAEAAEHFEAAIEINPKAF